MRISSFIRCALLAAALGCAFAASAAGRPWTGLAESAEAPAAGTAERALFDGKNALRSNKLAAAKDMLQGATRMDPNLAEAFFWLAGAQRALGEWMASQASLHQALRLDPSLGGHLKELDRFNPTAATPSGPGGDATGTATASSCMDVYTACRISATQCTALGCQTDPARLATCTAERSQCEQKSGR